MEAKTYCHFLQKVVAGHRFGKCSGCKSMYGQQWRNRNKDKCKIEFKKWYATNRESVLKYKQSYRKNNPEKVKAATKKWKQENKEIVRSYYHKQKYENPEKHKAQVQAAKKNRDKYKANNLEKIKKINKDYKSKNLAHFSAKENERRALKIKAMPCWISSAQVLQIYNFYKARPQGHHVDHIVPLKGKNVCGLHVPWNLQYLPAIDNLKKGNRFV